MTRLIDTFLFQVAVAEVIVEVIVAVVTIPFYVIEIKIKIKIKILASNSICMLLQSNSFYHSSFHRSLNTITEK